MIIYISFIICILSCKTYKEKKIIMQSMKQSVSVTIEKDLVNWVDGKVKTMRFRNRSHLFEMALFKFRENEQKE